MFCFSMYYWMFYFFNIYVCRIIIMLIMLNVNVQSTVLMLIIKNIILLFLCNHFVVMRHGLHPLTHNPALRPVTTFSSDQFRVFRSLQGHSYSWGRGGNRRKLSPLFVFSVLCGVGHKRQILHNEINTKHPYHVSENFTIFLNFFNYVAHEDSW